MDKVNLAEKLTLIHEHWRPKVVGALNGQEVKLVKFRGTCVWHHHEHEDELFLALRGRFRIEFLVALLFALGFVPRLRDARLTLHSVFHRFGLVVGLDRENVEFQSGSVILSGTIV